MLTEEPTGLKTLPLELQLNIVKHLGYGSLLTLRRTNRHFCKVADCVECSDVEKSSFV